MPIYGQNHKKNGALGVHFYTILVGTQISTVEPLTAKRSGRGADRRRADTADTKEGDERMDTGLRQALAGPLLGVVTAAVAGPDVSAWPLRPPPPRDRCARRLATHHQPRPR